MSKTTNKKSNMKTIDIPVEYEEQVRMLLGQIHLQEFQCDTDVGEASEQSETSGPSNSTNIVDYEVKSVIDHRLDRSGNFEFNVKWVGYNKETSWLTEEECENCEKLVSDYLHSKNINTCYCFCRVSSKAQTGPTHVSLDAQASELKKRACQTGTNRHKIIKISASAYKGIPLRLLRIGEACGSGDVILIYRVDRLSRNIVKFLSWFEELDNRGVSIIANSENLSYHENKLDFIQGVLDANKEAQLIGKKVKMSIEYRKQRGDEKIGGLPYGKKYERKYHPTKVDDQGRPIVEKLIVVNDDEALKTIKGIQSKHNVRPEIIANNLNSRGIRKRGRKWSVYMVRKIQETSENWDTEMKDTKQRKSKTTKPVIVKKIDTKKRTRASRL